MRVPRKISCLPGLASYIRNIFSDQVLLILIAVTSALRIFVCFYHNPLDYLFSDPGRHWKNGANLFNPDFISGLDPIVYQIYIWFIRTITSDNRYLVAFSCALLSCIMPWTFYRAALALKMPRKVALSIWIIIGLSPSFISIYHYFMMETLLLPLIGASIWATAKYERNPTRNPFLAGMLLWSFAVMAKPTVAPLAVACMGVVWWQNGRDWRLVVWGVAMATVIVIPNCLRSNTILGFPAPFGNPWLVRIQYMSEAKTIRIDWNGKYYYQFSSPSCYIAPLAPLSNWGIRKALNDDVVLVTADAGNGNTDWREVFEREKIGPLDMRWWNQKVENMILLFFAPSWPDSSFLEVSGYLNYLSRWIWAPLIWLTLYAGIEVILAQKKVDFLMTGFLALPIFLLFQNSAIIEGRYRKPLEPVMILCLAQGLTLLRNRCEVKKIEEQGD
jgi:hypothetical protein